MQIFAAVYAIDDEGAARSFGLGVRLESANNRAEDIAAITRALKMPSTAVVTVDAGDAYTLDWPGCDIQARIQPVP